MSVDLLAVAIAAASLGGFAAAYAAARMATRPARVRPAPATPDLGTEPPALVSLLANRWRLTEDASESTLLDLAARGYLELRQPGNDPRHTTIHLRPPPPSPAEPLLPYEQRVLDRVQQLAVDGMVPVTALTFRNEHLARRWNRALHRDVVQHARIRGLSQARFGRRVKSALWGVAAGAGGGIGLAAARVWPETGEELTAGLWAGGMASLLLSGIAGRPLGERDTAAGRAVAARWLGVRAWLRAHEEFATLPPAAVTVWDRYLPYGAALGVTRTASEILDLGLGDRRLVWSSYGGTWRRVRVRYPWLWRRYGRSTWQLVLRALMPVPFGAVALYYADPVLQHAGWPPLLAGLALLGYGGYMLLRTVLDLFTTREIVGEVLWRQLWRSDRNKSGSVPWLDYLAVDDGRADRTTAWGLPRGISGRVDARQLVRIRVRPWSRRIVQLTVLPGEAVLELLAEITEALREG